MKFECNKCSLYKYKGPLKGEGPIPSDLMIVGQVPTLIDADKEKLFIGKVGEQLDLALSTAGINRSQVYITNVVKCYVPSSKTITKTQILKCGSIHLEEEIKKVKPKVILVLGNIASKYFGKKFIVNSYFYSEKYQCYIVITYHPMKFIFTYDDELFNTFKKGFIIAKNLLEKEPKKQIDLGNKVIKDSITLKDLIPLGDTFALDLETTGVEFYKNDIVTIGLSNGNYTLGCPFQKNKEVLSKFLINKRIIGSNIKFDYKFLKRNGISIDIYFDDMLAHSLIDPISPHNLQAMSLKYLHTKLSKGEIDFDNTTISEIDYNQWSNYVANDSWMTFKLYEVFKTIIDKEYKFIFYNVVIPTTKWLAEAEFRGIKVDRDYIKQEMKAIEYRMKEIELEINNLQLIKDFKQNQKLDTFNLMSPSQISKLLYAFIGLEGKGTGEAVLLKLSEKKELEFLKLILEYRQLSKGYKTYLLNLYEDSQYDGRIHTTYSQITVPSGRLSCLPYYTRIVTEKEIKEIQSIKIGDKVLTPYGYKKVLNIQNTGQKILYKIHTNRGIIECSEEHQWLTPEGWKTTNKLKTNDYILGTRNTFKRGDQLIGNKFAYFLGVVIGDGHLDYNKLYNKYYKVVISYDSKYDNHINYIQSLFPNSKSYTQQIRSKILCINNVKLCQWVAKLGFNVKHIKANVPSIIFKSDLNVIRNFIAGYFDADGGVVGGNKTASSRSTYSIFFSSSSLQLVTDIQELLNLLGISTRINTSTTWLNKKEFKTYKLTIGSIKDIEVFFKLIPIRNSYKKEKIKKILINSKRTEYSLVISIPSSVSQTLVTNKYIDYYKITSKGVNTIKDLYKEIIKAEQLNPRYFKINNIEKTNQKILMYDIEVENVHQYIVNGFICHNSRNPNLQNIPKSSNISTIVRKAFIAAPGYTLIEADYSQAEFRIFAHLSRDAKMIELINSGKDIHRIMASVAYMKPENEITDKERTTAKCVSGDTYIYTDKGLIQIKDLFPKKLKPDSYYCSNRKVANKDGNLKSIKKLYYNGVQDTIKIKVTGQLTLEGSKKNHRILTPQGLKYLKDLRVGDKVLIKFPKSSNQYQYIKFNFWTHGKENNDKFTSESPTIKIGELWSNFIGLFQGDGGVAGRRVFFVQGIKNYKDLFDHYTKILNKLGFNHYSKIDRTTYLSQINYILLRRFLTKLGVVGPKGKIFRVPNIIKQSPLSVISKYLQGLFDTDGWVVVDNQIGFCTKDEVFAREIQQLLLYFHICASVHKSWNKTYQRYYYVVSITNKQEMYYFYKFINFASKKKRKKLEKTILKNINKYKNEPVKDYKIVKILSIKESRNDLFDLEIDDKDHLYLTNGFVSHNTLTFGILYGRGVKSIAEQLNISYEEAINVRNTITEVFKDAVRWVEKVQNFAKQYGFVKTMTGRKVLLHGVYSKEPERVAYDLRRAVNQPVQGGAADLTNLAGYYIMEEFKNQNLDAYILLNVHDAIYVECRDEIVPRVKNIITKIMVEEVPKLLKLRVNLKIDIKQGKNLLFKKN